MGRRRRGLVFGTWTFLLLVTAFGVVLNGRLVAGWSNGGYSANPSNPDYGTHDWIAQHALDWLPTQEKQYILDDLAAYLYGTELPDNSGAPDGIGDTAKHHIYYNSAEVMTDDAAAVRASTEYNNTLNFLKAKDYVKAAKNAGIMSHYIVDVAVFGHVMGSGTDWGAEVHHSDYETYVNERTSSYIAEFNSYLSFDGNLTTISACDAAKNLAYDTTFDVDGDLTCIWMDQNYNWSDSTFKNRAGESLNLAVNYLADVLHTLYLDATTWTVDDDGPADFSKIQDAINAASSGDTIFVHNGTYYERVTITKSNLILRGENREATIIDGNGAVFVVEIVGASQNVTVTGFTIQNGGTGIVLSMSHYNYLIGNAIKNNGKGISFSISSGNTLRNNTMTGNLYNFGVSLFVTWAPFHTMYTELFLYIQDIDTSNTVDGKSVYYWVNEHNRQIPSDAGYVAIVNSTNITVKNLELANNREGVLLAYSSGCNVENVNASNNYFGVYSLFSNNTTFNGNVLTNNNGIGLLLLCSSGNVLRENNVMSNQYNFGVWGYLLPHFIEDIDTSNTVDGKPIYYWMNQYGRQVPSEAAYIAIINSTAITVKDLTQTKNLQGVLFAFTANSTIENVNASNNYDCGVFLFNSSRNVIKENTMTSNGWGSIWLLFSHNNSIYHNALVRKMIFPPPIYESYHNVWDDDYPSGGNYWSDYTGVDGKSGPNQDQPGSDGIGDTPYVIDENNQDHYPLMGSFNTFIAGTWNDVTYYVDVVSNSTVSNFAFSVDQKLISFNVTGLDGTVGFSRVTVSNILLGGPYVVLVGGSPPSSINEMSNGTHTFLYFTYSHSTRQINVIGTTVIPEFPSAMILPLLMALSVTAAVFNKRKKESTHRAKTHTRAKERSPFITVSRSLY